MILILDLSFSHLVFSATEQLSCFLQTKDVSLQEALRQAAVAVRFFERNRSDEAFCYFYKQVVEESKNFTEPPTLPRIRRPPRRYDSDSDPHFHQTPDDYYRQMYFEVIDIIKSEIARRFDQGSLGLLLDIESTLLKAANFQQGQEHISMKDSVLQFYTKDIDSKKIDNAIKPNS